MSEAKQYRLMDYVEVVNSMQYRNLAHMAEVTGIHYNALWKLSRGLHNPDRVTHRVMNAVMRYIQDHP